MHPTVLEKNIGWAAHHTVLLWLVPRFITCFTFHSHQKYCEDTYSSGACVCEQEEVCKRSLLKLSVFLDIESTGHRPHGLSLSQQSTVRCGGRFLKRDTWLCCVLAEKRLGDRACHSHETAAAVATTNWDLAIFKWQDRTSSSLGPWLFQINFRHVPTTNRKNYVLDCKSIPRAHFNI